MASAITGCGAPKLDTSNEARLKESLKAMAERLPDEATKKKLAASVMLLAMPEMIKGAFPLAMAGVDVKPSMVSALKPFDGMTAQEIMDSAKDRLDSMKAAMDSKAEQQQSESKPKTVKFVSLNHRIYAEIIKAKTMVGYRSQHSPSMTLAVMRELQSKALDEVADRFGTNRPGLDRIEQEGKQKSWPVPDFPDPY